MTWQLKLATFWSQTKMMKLSLSLYWKRNSLWVASLSSSTTTTEFLFIPLIKQVCMIMARWFIKQFLHCRPGLDRARESAISCHSILLPQEQKGWGYTTTYKNHFSQFTRKLNVWLLIHSACMETSTMLSYSTSHNSQVATTASLRFADRYTNPNWNWELQT